MTNSVKQECICSDFHGFATMINSACFHYQEMIDRQTDKKTKQAMIRTRRKALERC